MILARIFGFKSVGFKKNGAHFWDISIDFDFFFSSVLELRAIFSLIRI